MSSGKTWTSRCQRLRLAIRMAQKRRSMVVEKQAHICPNCLSHFKNEDLYRSHWRETHGVKK